MGATSSSARSNNGINNNQLYSSNLNGTGLALFGTPIAGFSGEIYVSASLGIGGYGPRDVFAGLGSRRHRRSRRP